MIGLVSGTSEGKEILSGLNEFTEDIFVSTATQYGGELLKKYKYRILNENPLNLEEIIEVIRTNNIKVMIDATHPYATEVSKNIMSACKSASIEYIRYERPSLTEKYIGNSQVRVVSDYNGVREALMSIHGNILNTTGSKAIEEIMSLQMPNRIIHRVLPTLKVFSELDQLKISPEDIVAIKGPISESLNIAFIDEYDGKAILTKDSGERGGLEEKIQAAIKKDIPIIIIARKKMSYPLEFNDIIKLIEYIRGEYIND